jgi:hypothetical protein
LVQGGLQAVPIVGKAAKPLARFGMNALLHGGGAALGDLTQQAAEQHTFLPSIDIERLKAAAAMGAAGGGVGALMHKAPKQLPGDYTVNGQLIKRRQTTGPVNPMQIGHRINGQVMTEAQQKSAALIKGIQDKINEAVRKESVSHQQTLQVRKNALKSLYEKLSIAGNSPNATPEQVRIGNMAKQRVLEAHATLERHYNDLYGKQPKAQKAQKEHITNPDDLKALVGMVKQMRAEGSARQADVAMGQFTQETKARVYDEVKRQEKPQPKQAKGPDLQKLKEKQAVDSAKALEKAQTGQRERELKQLKGDIKQRSEEAVNEQKRQSQQQKGQQPAQGQQKAKADNQQKRQAKTVNEPRMTGEQIRAEVKKAEKSKESIVLRYRAEKYGETGEYQYKTVHDPRLEIGRNGQVMVRGINAEGQARTYLERDSSGSEILSVERTKKPSEYQFETNPETNKQEVRHLESDEIVTQVKKEGKKSSEIRSDLAKMEQIVQDVKAGKRVNVKDVMDAARALEKTKELENSLETMPEKARKELHEKITGEPC